MMRENPISKRTQGPDAMPVVPRWEFFQTIAGPGETAYPVEGDAPYCYYAKQLKNVTFTEAVGSPTLNFDLTDKLAYVFNLAQEDYIEVNSVILAQRKNGRWWTVDKVRVTVADVYKFGGSNGHNDGYTISSDAWSIMEVVPSPARQPLAGSLAGLAYAVGTIDAASSRVQIDEYSPTANSWTARTDNPLTHPTISVLPGDGSLYQIRDLSSGSSAQSAWSQSGNSWSTLTSAPGAADLRACASATDGTDGYYFGGGGTTPSNAKVDTSIYDVSGDSWSAGTDMPRKRMTGTAFSSGTSAYVMAGRGASANETNDIYSFAGDSWSTGTDVPRDTTHDRLDAMAAFKDGSGYVMGGTYNVGSVSFKNDAYSVSGDSWSSLEAIPTGRNEATGATAP